jgi:hypothetical protein
MKDDLNCSNLCYVLYLCIYHQTDINKCINY